ncbi:hypothetical protein B0H34DRAFT_129788 [Crassisporium funariophilum]|nr:hypothetical protein B0H34DRAFT_129788 [Crassisporium funariophilum]
MSYGILSYAIGGTLKTNLMNGQPSRTKSAGDYVGLSIPPCGDYAQTSDIRKATPPWLLTGAKATQVTPRVTLSLNDEIAHFMNYMRHTSTEIAMRRDLLQRFTRLINSSEIVATVQPVGSCVTGLCLPTSDIDMVLTLDARSTMPSIYCTPSSQLALLRSNIHASGFASNIDSVLHASVPLIRITDKITGIEIDLTAADKHGVKATKAVLKWIKGDSDVVKTLILIVKTFLSIRRCGTTYTGGINSYMLVWMVVAWVHLEMPKMAEAESSVADVSSLTAALEELSVSSTSSATSARPRRPDLGKVLIRFLKFYAEDFDYYTESIKIEPTPCYSVKTYPYSRYPITQRYLLSIFDPADTSIDMGSKAYAIKHIQESFKEAYKSLLDLERKRKEGHQLGVDGVLGAMLGGDFSKFVSKREAAIEGWRKSSERKM